MKGFTQTLTGFIHAPATAAYAAVFGCLFLILGNVETSLGQRASYPDFLTPRNATTETARAGSSANSDGPSCANVIIDGSFENGGIPSSTWDPETDTIFGTPVCNLSQCGTGGGVAGPSSGNFWVWFGDVGPAQQATIGQTVNIASGSTALLTFQLRIGRVASPFADVMNVRVDGVIRTTFAEPTTAESAYSLRTVDLSEFADGGQHLILFEYIHPASDGASFSLDDVSLNVCPAASTPRSAFDYDGDGRADLSVRRPSDNIWYLLRGTAGYTAMQYGVPGDRMVPADYDGDAQTDVAMFRPSNGTWYIYMSQSQTFQTFVWGEVGDLPVPTDRDADGRTDLVVYRESNNIWYTRFANGTFAQTHFGVAGDKPVVGDFDGDRIGDIAVYRPSNNNWYIIKSSIGFFIQTWGETGDIPITGDFDGDGATDQAVFRPSTGQWFKSQTTAGFESQTWGVAGDIPVAADYDGDGKTDVAVFRPSTGEWYIVNSTAGILVQQFGLDGDVPTQSAFNY